VDIARDTYILRTPEIRDRLAGDSAEVVAGSPEQLTQFLNAEIVKWARAVKAAGITPE